VEVGGYSGNQTDYINRINSCGNRAAANIDLNLSFDWMGNSTMKIRVSVLNNDTSSYTGYLVVYVTEAASSLGWKDKRGKLMTHAFLDYAIRESVYVEPGDTFTDSTTWMGYQHTNGMGQTFAGITRTNTTVIAAVFNPQWYQGYSNPPSGYPFNAYYVDDAAAAWINVPPDVPNDSLPQDSARAVSPYLDLRWTCIDSNYLDQVVYDVYFGTVNPPPFVVSKTSAVYDPGTMPFGTTYYWRIVAKDNSGDSTVSPLWTFTTIARGDCNADGRRNISDVLYLVNYLFKYGDQPNPLEIGNVDCDTQVSTNDIIYLIDYFFKGGPAICQ
jgi:hypothetical protein